MTTMKMIRPPKTMSTCTTSTLNDDVNVNTCTAKSPCTQRAGYCESETKIASQQCTLNYHLVDCPLCETMIQVADHLSLPNESRFKSVVKTADGLREIYSKVLARTHCSEKKTCLLFRGSRPQWLYNARYLCQQSWSQWCFVSSGIFHMFEGHAPTVNGLWLEAIEQVG